MITVATLKDHSRKDLAEMAKKMGVVGWHGMRKEQLVRSLTRKAKAKSKTTQNNGRAAVAKVSTRSAASSARQKGGPAAINAAGATASSAKSNGHAAKSNGHASKANGQAANGQTIEKITAVEKAKNTRISRKIRSAHEQRERRRDLSYCDIDAGSNGHAGSTSAKDRIVLMVRDAYWLHVCWEVSRQNVTRAKAAMAEQWHTAKPILRLVQVDSGTTTSTAERIVRDVEIHGGVKNWYIDVPQPPKSYRVDIGYKGSGGRFHVLSRSNVVTTPVPGSHDSLDENWRDIAEDYERVFAMSGGYSDDTDSTDLQELFEERLCRPMGSQALSRYGSGAERLLGRHRPFIFEVDAELIVFGRTKSDAHLTLAGEPVKLREDGSFTVRIKLPDRRQVLPVVANSADGVEQRTIILAVERNTKVMEPVTSENAD